MKNVQFLLWISTFVVIWLKVTGLEETYDHSEHVTFDDFSDLMMTSTQQVKIGQMTSIIKTTTMATMGLSETSTKGSLFDRLVEEKEVSTLKYSSVFEDVGTMVVRKDTSKHPGLLEDVAEEPTPPDITFPLSHEMLIVQSNLHAIRCSARGYPTPIYSWKRNDLDIPDSQHIKSFNNGTLLLIDFSNREAGYYQCFAKNQFGTASSVKVPVFRDISPSQERRNVTLLPVVTEGDPLNVTCAKTPFTRPSYIKRWYYVETNSELPLDSRVGVDKEGTLRFAYVKSTDTSKYQCGLVPPFQHAQSINFYEKTEVHVNPKLIENKKPKIEFATKSVKGYVGKNATLQCFFSGYNLPMIEWINNHNAIITTSGNYSIEDYSRQLVIMNLQESNEGNYICIAKNDHGEETVQLALNVTTPPMRATANDGNFASVSLTTLTSPDSKTVTLNCKARAAYGESINPPVWYRNAELLTKENLPDPERYSFHEHQTSLTIKNLKKETDTANYQCNISNSEGYFFQTGYLRVIQAIQIIKKPKARINILSSNGDIDLSVLATGDPSFPLTYKWTRNDKLIIDSDLDSAPFFNYSSRGHLIFNKGDLPLYKLEPYMGNFSCNVSNLYDHVVVSFVLETSAQQSSKTEGNISLMIVGHFDPMTFRPYDESTLDDFTTKYVNPETQTAEFQLWWVLLICGLLLLAIAVVIIVVLIKTNFPRNTYPLEKTELKHHLNPEEDLLNQSFQEI